jgi:hypothetical protein
MLEGWPWRPFFHTLGISGHEVYFSHPDELYYALALALPWLPKATADKARALLAEQLGKAPPYAVDGFDQQAGRLREAYDVPARLRLNGRGKASSAFGVYAFWAYCHYAPDAVAARAHWPAVKERLKPLLETAYQFDIRKTNYAKDEAEKLNGDLAGLVGAARLARLNADPALEQRLLDQTAILLNLRVNLERVNPKILEKTSATKSLHVSKLARFCALTPELGAALRQYSDGCGAAHLRAFREARNGWFLAFADRLIGGENYTNPLHFSRALFAGAALVEQLPPETLLTFLDVPHCPADFYFIEKCALALRTW